jgi:hypothetical protein
MGARVLIGFELVVEILQRFLGITRQFGRDHHFNGGKKVTLATPGPEDASTPYAKGLAAPGSGRHLEPYCPVQRWHVDLRTEGGFREGDWEPDGDVIAFPFENGMSGNVGLDEKVSGRPAIPAR